MNAGRFMRAAVTQTALVAVLFAFLLVLPLPAHFFREWGALVGPLAWIACSLGTGRLLGLSLVRTAIASAAGGLAAALAGIVVEHALSLPVAIAVFAACCAEQRLGQRPADELALSLGE
ncbi:MAG: hypothetical protein NVSMB25_12050 [Thermoleophilaceae bacterium]